MSIDYTTDRKQATSQATNAMYLAVATRAAAMSAVMNESIDGSDDEKMGTALFVADECKKFLAMIEGMKAARL